MALTKVPIELSSTPGIVDNSNATAITIDSSENVGIGTSPSYKLDVFGSSAVSMVRTNDTTSPTLGLFVNSGSNGVGTISVDNGGHMTFDTGSTGAGQAERMRIDASGNVGIGSTDAASFGKFLVNGTGNLLNLNATSGVAYQAFYENGAGRFYLGTLNGSDGLAFIDADGSTERMRIDSSGNLILKKNLVLESTSEGIDFSGVGSSAKTLDDYEEGAWNPTVTSSAGTITTVTSPIGTYTKIGRTVIVQYQFNITTLGTASGNIIVSGRPFTEDNSEISYYAGVHRARSGASSITEFDPDGTFQLYGTTPVAGVYLGSMVYNTTS